MVAVQGAKDGLPAMNDHACAQLRTQQIATRSIAGIAATPG
jgi:hypothetical protein